MKPVRATSAAEADFAEAVAYYENERPGLGSDFIEEIAAVQAIISQYPRSGRMVSKPYRRYRLRRFPYGVYYCEEESDIIVVAILHLHRRPNHWADRV